MIVVIFRSPPAGVAMILTRSRSRWSPEATIIPAEAAYRPSSLPALHLHDNSVSDDQIADRNSILLRRDGQSREQLE